MSHQEHAIERSQLLESLHTFIIREVLDGDGLGLDETTPLLRYGIINSITLVSLLTFIEEQFSITVPSSELVPQNLMSLGTIVDLLLRIHALRSSSPNLRDPHAPTS